MGSDGNFSVGSRPVPGTEQEVTDTDRPKDWSDGGLARTGTKGAGTAIAASGTGQAQGVGGESVQSHSLRSGSRLGGLPERHREPKGSISV